MPYQPGTATSIGSTIGLLGGPLGVVLGTVVGAVVDVVLSYGSRKKARRKMRKAMMRAIIKKYQTQVFVSTLERMAAAMMHLAELKVKPGTKQYDKLLQKMLFREIGYTGDCGAMILEPAKPGEKRKVLAVMERGWEWDGTKWKNSDKMTSYSLLDASLGPKWHEACRDLHEAALKSWAEDKALDILEERARKAQSAESKRNLATRVMVNGGIALVLLGYSIRKKRQKKGVS